MRWVPRAVSSAYAITNDASSPLGLVWTSPQTRTILEISGLVLVLVLSKTMKRLDWTRLLSSIWQGV